MNTTKFLRKGLFSLMTLFAVCILAVSCDEAVDEPSINPFCLPTSANTAGAYTTETPADLERTNIVGDRTGMPLTISLRVQKNIGVCEPYQNLTVDVWHCDANGNYSQYAGQVDGDFSSADFLRGRQTTNESGTVSFTSIYPGWVAGSAPRIYVEISDSDGSTILVTQLALPEFISNEVYATTGYNGNQDTSNNDDSELLKGENAIEANVSGNATDGYALSQTINIVP